MTPDPAMIDPAWSSVFNSALLIGGMIFGASRVDKFARDLARTAKGSEARAEAAAAEITRLKDEITAHLKAEAEARKRGPR